jgi:hypothetical protein
MKRVVGLTLDHNSVTAGTQKWEAAGKRNEGGMTPTTV